MGCVVLGTRCVRIRGSPLNLGTSGGVEWRSQSNWVAAALEIKIKSAMRGGVSALAWGNRNRLERDKIRARVASPQSASKFQRLFVTMVCGGVSAAAGGGTVLAR